jgi:hypothetical protein
MSGLVIDAAYPPPAVPAGLAGVMGYIGQHGKAYHVWTPQEWQPFHAVRQFPCWVPDFGATPASEAADAVNAAVDLGWAAHEPAGQTRALVLDMETVVSRSWYAAWAAVVDRMGFAPVCYGSMSTVLANAAANNIVADWDDLASIPAGQTINGVQYRANVSIGSATVDYDLFGSWLMARGGVGPRKGA